MAAHPSAFLVFLTARPASGQRIPLTGPRLLVGRDPRCDLRLDGGHVRRLHAALQRRDGRWLVRNLGSEADTKVNGTPVAGPVALCDGDILSFGAVSLRFQLEPSAGSTATA